MTDITEIAHERDSAGELIAVEETVTVHGEDYDVRVYPATTGQQNEWRNRLEDEGDELPDDITFELCDEFADYGPGDFNAESWADVRPAITEAISSAALSKIFDAESAGAFTEALEDAAAEATEGNR